MARKRIIDTEELYFKTELVNSLKDRGLHFYIRLWGIAEDWGGYEFNPEDLALRMGALKFSGKEVSRFAEILVSMGKIIPYQINGKKYHWIKNFQEHQPLNNPSPPHLPLPEWIMCELKKYKSGKTYAIYRVVMEKLPVGYQYPTGNEHTETETKRNETETKRKRKVTASAELEDRPVTDQEPVDNSKPGNGKDALLNPKPERQGPPENVTRELSLLVYKIEAHYKNEFRPLLWIQNNLRLNWKTHLLVMQRIAEYLPEIPKAYADKVASIEEGNFNEREHSGKANDMKGVFQSILSAAKQFEAERKAKERPHEN